MSNIKQYFQQDAVKNKFNELLGQRASAFITSVLQIANSNEMLKDAEPASVYNAAAVAATLNLPLNNAIGHAYIVPFKEKQKDGGFKTKAQFMLGYKGFIQLAQRSGQFKTISAAPVYEGQLIEENPLTGFVFDWKAKKSEKVVGYAAYFQLITGFEKTLYMTVGDLEKHGKRFSQTFKKGFGLWKDDFDNMAQKTVLKLLLSKYAPLSIDMQKAVVADQAIVQDADTLDVSYVDNSTPVIDDSIDRIAKLIESATTLAELNEVELHLPEELIDLFESKKQQLNERK
jgi:recombination protein RecT